MAGHVVAIIQARMGSTRLPGKVLKDISGQPMLRHVANRVRAASLVDKTVVATTVETDDDDVANYCSRKKIPFTRGSESNVLDRYYQTATEFDADTVVRITADCPLLSPSLVDRAVWMFNDSSAAYVSNKVIYEQPDGLDVEVLGYDALENAYEQVTSDYEREHVTPFIRNNDSYESLDVPNPVDTSRYSITDKNTILRWTVDYMSDLTFVREVFDRLWRDEQWLFDQIAVFELLERNPELLELTEHAAPKEYENV